MKFKNQIIALNTMIRFELVRMFRIAIQVFLPPVVTTLLYFLIFGSVIGSRIGSIHDLSYATYIAPGLLMLTVINNVYGNVSTSLFSARFQKFIEELLISPMSNALILLGFVCGGVIRGLLVSILVLIVECFFVDIKLVHLPQTFLIIVIVSILFSLLGFLNGMLAHNFEGISIVPVFVLTPLIYLGGVFYSIDMLSPLWQKLAYFDPIFYMINALRQVMTGQEQSIHMSIALSIIIGFSVVMIMINMYLLKQGRGLRN